MKSKIARVFLLEINRESSINNNLDKSLEEFHQLIMQDLIDYDGNSFFNMESDLIMYTCYNDGIMATLWVLA